MRIVCVSVLLGTIIVVNYVSGKREGRHEEMEAGLWTDLDES